MYSKLGKEGLIGQTGTSFSLNMELGCKKNKYLIQIAICDIFKQFYQHYDKLKNIWITCTMFLQI